MCSLRVVVLTNRPSCSSNLPWNIPRNVPRYLWWEVCYNSNMYTRYTDGKQPTEFPRILLLCIKNKILGVLWVVTTNQIDANGRQSPCPLIRCTIFCLRALTWAALCFAQSIVLTCATVVEVQLFFFLYYPSIRKLNPFTTGNPFLGTKLLGFSIGRGSGALKGLRPLPKADFRRKKKLLSTGHFEV